MPKKSRAGKKRGKRKSVLSRSYKKKSRISRPILGTSGKNRCQLCGLVSTSMPVKIPAGSHCPEKPLSVLINSIHFLPQTVCWQNSSTIPYYRYGFMRNYAIRKALTMYNEFKIDGVYITIRARDTCEYGAMKIYSYWDRKNVYGRGQLMSASGTNAYEFMKAAAEVQGRKAFYYGGDTKISFNTKCTASSIQEKTTWVDTEIVHSEQQYTFPQAPSQTVGWNNYGVRTWQQNDEAAGFCPAFYWTFYTREVQDTAGILLFDIDVKYYVSFRNPGLTQTPLEIQQLMLTPNWGQMWTVTETKSGEKIRTPIYDDPPPPDESSLLTSVTVLPTPTKVVRTDTTMLGDDDEEE